MEKKKGGQRKSLGKSHGSKKKDRERVSRLQKKQRAIRASPPGGDRFKQTNKRKKKTKNNQKKQNKKQNNDSTQVTTWEYEIGREGGERQKTREIGGETYEEHSSTTGSWRKWGGKVENKLTEKKQKEVTESKREGDG